MSIELDSELLAYIVREHRPGDRLPTISELQDEHLGLSVSKLREQLEVARALGFVEVRSKTGMKMKSYSFTPAVRLSLRFALALDWRHFEQFTALRNHIETAFWDEACALLTPDDLALMQRQVESALVKLQGENVRIPNEEHRAFHMTVFCHLNNPFVTGLLEAYWDAYEAVEVHRYHDYDDLLKVWDYHGQILAALEAGDIAEAKRLFVEHTQLIRFKPEHRANGASGAAHIHKQPNV